MTGSIRTRCRLTMRLSAAGIGCVVWGLLLPRAAPAAPRSVAEVSVSQLWYESSGALTIVTVPPAPPLTRNDPIPRVQRWDRTGARLQSVVGEFEVTLPSWGVHLVAAAAAEGAVLATYYTELTPTPGRPKARSALGIRDRNGGLIAELPTGFESGVTDLAFSPDGNLLAVAGGGENCAFEVFDIKRKMKLVTRLGHPARLDIGASGAGKPVAVSRVAFSPDGKRLATGGADGCVRFWSVPRFEETARFDYHADRLDPYTANLITGLRFAPDGRTVYSAAYDGRVIGVDAGTGRDVRTIQACPLPAGRLDLSKLPVAMAVSPDGAFLATAGSDRVALWDTASGRLLAEDRDSSPALQSLAFSPDGRELAAPKRTRGVWRWAVGAKPSPGLKVIK